MRLRHIKGSEELMEESPWVISLEGLEAQEASGEISRFADGLPLCLEIGTGKGGFILQNARLYPEKKFIGMERQASALVFAVKKAVKAEEEMLGKLENLRFLYGDADRITDYFLRSSVQVIYLNFPDPWPKARHEGRRLTSAAYLRKFSEILSPEGRIELKTDNRGLFDYSLGQLDPAGYHLETCTYDLHGEPALCQNNVMTEYERKFVAEGVPICKYAAVIKEEA
ncbi:MAG: tRNA (guanosine(46)-N7)-methyltransferase TrmB [Lachnospiraceae bacterium]|nr:tRNA (guanosine(46)-N7)-methyltransferase TrmB [Lachnospiraceae bacterium]